jgi:peroxiredoxin
MRKKAAPFVFLFVCLVGGLIGTAGAPEETVRIFSSLEEAFPDPARPLLLVFFSLDCHLCWAELFELRYFLQENEIPVELVGISRDAEEELRPFLSKYGFSGPVVCDRRKTLYRKFKVRLEPFRIILGRGTVLFEDDSSRDFFARREEVKRCLLEIASH